MNGLNADKTLHFDCAKKMGMAEDAMAMTTGVSPLGVAIPGVYAMVVILPEDALVRCVVLMEYLAEAKAKAKKQMNTTTTGTTTTFGQGSADLMRSRMRKKLEG